MKYLSPLLAGGLVLLAACGTDAPDPVLPDPGSIHAQVTRAPGAQPLQATDERIAALDDAVLDLVVRVLPSMEDRETAARLQETLERLSSALQARSAGSAQQALLHAREALSAAEAHPGTALGHMADLAGMRMLLDDVVGILPDDLRTAARLPAERSN